MLGDVPVEQPCLHFSNSEPCLHCAVVRQPECNRFLFKAAFERHLRRQIQVRVVDKFAGVERQFAQKRFVESQEAPIPSEELACDYACCKGDCLACVLAYPATLRIKESFRGLQISRHSRVTRRFDKFVDHGGEESLKGQRVRDLCKQPRPKKTQGSLGTVQE